jgi:hypothetical protein
MSRALREGFRVCINSVAEVDARDARADIEKYFRKPTCAAPTLEHVHPTDSRPEFFTQTATHSISRDRRTGVRIELRQAVAFPLRSERGGVRVVRHESWYASHDSVFVAVRTDEHVA